MKTETVTHIAVSRLRANAWGTEVGPPLSSEDVEALKESIERNGIQIPLIVWQRSKQLIVLSGGNRLRIAKQLKLKNVPAILRSFANQDEAKLFAVTDNLARRHMNTGQRAYLAYQYQQLLAVGAGRRTDLQPSSTLTKVDSRKKAATMASVSDGSVSAIKAVMESGDKSLLADVLNGTITVHAAARYVKSEAADPRLPSYRSNGHSADGAVYTTIRGDSAELVEQVAKLYLQRGDVICDVTVGQSVFWRRIDLSPYRFHGTDLAMKPPVDLRSLPYADNFANHVILDPPHQHDVGVPITGARYNARRTVKGMSHDKIIQDLYGGGLKEAWRVLKPGGLCWVKCCDEVVAGHQRWSHIEILDIASTLGYEAIDLFILHRVAEPMVQHRRQLHARKNHSFLWMLKKINR